MTTAPSSPRRRPTAAAIIVVPLVVSVVVALFAWPMARQEPRDLPVGVAGPAAATDALAKKLDAGGFAVDRYPDEASARDAISDRDVYGAFVAEPGGSMKLLTATAASSRAAQTLTRVAEAAPGPAVHVEDAVPLSPAGVALPSAIFPLILAGTLTGAATIMLATGALRRVGLLVAGSVLAGAVAATMVQSWLDILGGHWLANAGVMSLMIMAIAATVAGLTSLLGQPGTLIGALTMIFIGNPFSANSSAPELLPRPVGDIGQLMPPGAGGNLLRSTGYFDGAAAGGHIAVLAVWALGGLTLLGLSALRGRRPATVAVPVPA
jgi:hypothetical protein